MNNMLRQFVEDTNARFRDRLNSPKELFNRWLTADECLDAAVIGGYGVRDILVGKVHESQIPPIVIQAFHYQYPHAGQFVDFVATTGVTSHYSGLSTELRARSSN